MLDFNITGSLVEVVYASVSSVFEKEEQDTQKCLPFTAE